MSVKNNRLKNGYTQTELAEKLNIHQTTVSHWEMGEDNPSLKNLRKLCNLFGCTMEELLTEEECNN